MPERLRSRKLWVAVLTAIAMLVGAALGLDLEPTEIGAVLAPVIAFILGQSYADGKNGG